MWEPRAVYGFVRAAGFRTEQWCPAVAVALACSAGDSLYRDVAWPGPSVDRRGLFAIDVVAHSALGDLDLFDPRDNCRAAYALWNAADGAWTWAGCPVPGRLSEAYEAAADAVRRGPAQQPLARGIAYVATPGTVTGDTLRSLAGISDFVRSRIRPEG